MTEIAPQPTSVPVPLPPQSSVPPHFHKDDRIEAKNLIPNGDYRSTVPTETAPEGTEVQYLNGTDFRIYPMVDGAWRSVPASASSFVRVHLGTNTSAIGAQQLSLDTVDFDTNSEFDTTSHQFTPKSAGYFHVYASAYFSGSTTNNQYALKIYKNNAEVSESNKIRVNASDDPFTIAVSDIVYLTPSDHLDIYAYTNAAVSGTINHGS